MATADYYLILKKHFQRGHSIGNAEKLHGGCQRGNIRIGGGDTDGFVLRVNAVWEGSTGRRQGEAGLGTEVHTACGGAGKAVETDEIAALGSMPLGNAPGSDLSLKVSKNAVELGLYQSGLAAHVAVDAVHVMKELHMAKLVDLVVAKGLYAHLAKEEFHIFFAGGQDRKPCAGKGDFAG